MAVVCFVPPGMGRAYITPRKGTGLATGRPRDLTHILADLVQATAQREQYNIGMAVLGSQMDMMHAARARVEADIESLQGEYSAAFRSFEAGHSLKNIVPVVEENAARAGLASRAAFLRQAAKGPNATGRMPGEQSSGTGGVKTTAEVAAANAKVATANARLAAANARARHAVATARKKAVLARAEARAEARAAARAAEAKAVGKPAGSAVADAQVVEAKNAGAGAASEKASGTAAAIAAGADLRAAGAGNTAADSVGAAKEAGAYTLAVGEVAAAEEHKDADTEAASTDEEVGEAAGVAMAKEARDALARRSSSDDEDGARELSPETEELIRAAHIMAEVVPVSMVMDVDFPIIRTP